MNWWQHFFYSIDANAWIQTLSGFVGALLAGGVAIFLYIGQNKQQRKKERIAELESFLKAYIHLQINLKAAFEYIETASTFETMEIDEEHKAVGFRQAYPFVTNHLEKIKLINFESMPYEIYPLCVVAVNSLEDVREIISLKSDVRTSNYLPGVIKDFLETLKSSYEEIEKYKVLATTELKQLKI